MTATVAPGAVTLPAGIVRSLRDEATARRAAGWLLAHGFPGPKEEAWHYTRPADLVAALDRPPTSGTGALDDGTRRIVDGLHRRVVLRGGRPAAALDDLLDLPDGVTVRLRDAGDATFDGEPLDGFDALNRAAAPAVLHVAAARGTDGGLLHVVHLPGGHAGADHVRVRVDAAPGSRLRVVEVFLGRDGGTTNAATVVRAGTGAEVTHQRVQLDADTAVHVGTTRVHVGRDATVRLTAVDAGAALARHTLDVVLAEPGATVALDGLLAPRAGQHHDLTATVAHRAPHGTSAQHVRGLAAADARTSFTGHVVVGRGAAGTDAAQRNDNLLLDRSARADTRPWLEIDHDAVRCVHGATVGTLDDDALFYLRSRGIPAARARSMLVEAFVAEVLDLLPVGVRSVVADRVTDAGEG